jgi:hypothetical protein
MPWRGTSKLYGQRRAAPIPTVLAEHENSSSSDRGYPRRQGGQGAAPLGMSASLVPRPHLLRELDVTNTIGCRENTDPLSHPLPPDSWLRESVVAQAVVEVSKRSKPLKSVTRVTWMISRAPS